MSDPTTPHEAQEATEPVTEDTGAARTSGPVSAPPGRPDLKFERYGNPTAVLDVREAAAYLALSVSTVWRMVRNGTLPHVRLGPKAVRLRVGDLDRYIEERTSREWTSAAGDATGESGE